MNLVAPEVLETLEPALEARIATLREPFAVDPADSLYGRPFKYYLLFTHWPSLLPKELDAEDVLYNRYYWFLRFSELHELKNGKDAGLEQQRFQLLEQATCDFDWNVIQQIEAEVQRGS